MCSCLGKRKQSVSKDSSPREKKIEEMQFYWFLVPYFQSSFVSLNDLTRYAGDCGTKKRFSYFYLLSLLEYRGEKLFSLNNLSSHSESQNCCIGIGSCWVFAGVL